MNASQLVNGIPASGAKLFTYAAGSSTKQTTYKDKDGTVAHTNPIILDSRGEPDEPIWLTEGLSYKFVLAPSDDTDPPSSPIRTIDDISGTNDASVALSEWVDTGDTPSYVSATQFTVPGDKTSSYHANRRVKILVTAGTVYGRVTASAYTSLTTVTVELDSGALDAGLSNVQLGLITQTNPSYVPYGYASDSDLTSGLSSKLNTSDKASQAEAEAGTENTKYMTALRTKQAIDANAITKFTSSSQTITSGTTLTVAHGLGEEPFDYFAYLVCTTAEHGYSIGDKIKVGTTNHTASSSATDAGAVLRVDDTNVYVIIGDEGFWVHDKSTNDRAELTDGSWDLYVRAWV